MKIITFIFGALLLIFTATCDNSGITNTRKLTGKIEAQGITSYQYGSHTITTSEDQTYALRSERVNLEQYEGETITIRTRKIEGYPIEGGPQFLEVLRVLE